MGLQGLPVFLELLVRPVLKAYRVLLGLPDLRDRLVLLALKGFRALRVPLVLPALPELRGLRVLPVPPAQLLLSRDLRVLLALLVLLALRVPPDLPGQPVPLELRGLSAQQVLRGRREALGPILIAIHRAVQARVSIGSTATMGRCLSGTTTATAPSGLSLVLPVPQG